MNIYSNKTITNFVNRPFIRNAVSSLAKPSAMLPVILLEGSVIAGRTYNAHKRGGWVESRERATEEVITAIVWLSGIGALNSLFNNILEKRGLNDIKIDVGNDAIRNPITHAIKNKEAELRAKLSKTHTEKQIMDEVARYEKKLSMYKLGKILAATLSAIAMCGFLVPKLNQAITRAMTVNKNNQNTPLETEKMKNEPKVPNAKVDMQNFLRSVKAKTVSFTNGGKALSEYVRAASHNLENNNVWKLLSIDLGIWSGRAVNARNKDERREIIFRELASSYFYLFSTPLVFKLLSKHVDKFDGKNTNLDPVVANYIDKRIKVAMDAKGQKSMNIEEFKELVLGVSQIDNKGEGIDKINNVLEEFKNVKFVEISEFEQKLCTHCPNDKAKVKAVMDKANKFLKLRNASSSNKLLSISEVINCLYDGVINNPRVINNVVSKATDKTSRDSSKFITQDSIDLVKKQVQEYAQSIVEYAQRNTDSKSGKEIKITHEILDAVKNRNTIVKLGYMAVGLGISALFLSTIIPKLQYYITMNKTGKNEFPGARGLELKK